MWSCYAAYELLQHTIRPALSHQTASRAAGAPRRPLRRQQPVRPAHQRVPALVLPRLFLHHAAQRQVQPPGGPVPRTTRSRQPPGQARGRWQTWEVAPRPAGHGADCSSTSHGIPPHSHGGSQTRPIRYSTPQHSTAHQISTPAVLQIEKMAQLCVGRMHKNSPPL